MLAKGLFVSPRLIGLMTGTYPGLNAADAIDRVHNRVDTEFGTAALLGGFLLQAVGYVAVLLGADSATGGPETAVAVGLAVAAGGGVLFLWHLLRPRRTRRLMPDVALGYGPGERAGWTQQRAAVLLGLGRELGYPTRPDDEGKVAYARRVFGVELPPACN